MKILFLLLLIINLVKSSFVIQIEEILQFSQQEQEFAYFIQNIVLSATQYISEVLDVSHINLDAQKFSNRNCETKSSDLNFNIRPETDLIVILSIDNTIKYFVLGETCEYGANQRPVTVNLVFSKNILNIKFQSNDYVGDFYDYIFTSVLHELIHTIGFRKQFTQKYFGYSQVTDIINFGIDNQIRGIDTAFLKTPKLIEKAKVHFGCDTLEGVQLENLNGTDDDSTQSHWEATIMAQDIMSGFSVFQQSVISEITLALLEDTNWYQSVDYSLAEDMQWGKNKGCGFLNESCYNKQTNYTEFKQTQCSYDYKSYSNYYLIDQQPFDGCPYQYQFTSCQQSYQNFDLFQIPQEYGNESRCIIAKINNKQQAPLSEQPKCFEQYCIGNVAYIIIQNKSFRCSYNNQKFIVDDIILGYEGYFYCPDDLQRFCEIKSQCENSCSMNGYCLNGKCRCLLGYAGKYCEKKCNTGQLYKEGDDQCTTLVQCPSKFYLDDQYSQRTCLKCYVGCLTCEGSQYNQCLTCDTGYTHNTSKNYCYKNCNTGYGQQCLDNGYILKCLSNDKYLFNGECRDDCLIDGFYQNDLVDPKQCTQCPPNLQCKNCEYILAQTTIKCTQCRDGFLKYNEECMEFCPYKYYKVNQTCIPCHVDCAGCFGGNSNECLSCETGKLYNNSCVSECPINYKDTKNIGVCEEDFCLIARQDGLCVNQCSENEYIRRTDRQCMPCSSSCQSCIDYPDKCLTCPNSGDFIVDYLCTSSLPQSSNGFIIENNTSFINKFYTWFFLIWQILTFV